MTPAPQCGCITCGDEATAMRVLRLDGERGLALCEDDEGSHATVETALIPEVTVGDALLVHAGAALARLPGETTAGERA